MSGIDKEIEKNVEYIIANLLVGIGKLLSSIFYGIRSLRKWSFLWLFVWMLVGWALVRFRVHIWELIPKDKQSLKHLVYIGFAFPFIYLMYSGEKYKHKRNEMQEKFLEIGFFSGLKTVHDRLTGEKRQEKNTPVLLKKEIDGKKVSFTFKSNIPLVDWKKRGHELEALFNCHIVKIQPALKSKQIIIMHTIPAEDGLGDYVPWSNQFIRLPEGKQKKENAFEVVCGLSMLDEVVFDLARTPHILIAGLTGSGKSVLETCLTWQCIFKGAVVYMVDFKAGIEMSHFKSFGKVVKDRQQVIDVLKLLVEENTLRLNMLESVGCRDMEEYNAKNPEKKLSRVVLVCDEVAEMLDTTGADKQTKAEIQEILKNMATLARLGRAPGINLIMATQRPDANVLPGQIKGMLQVRISGLMKDKQNSEMIVGDTSAVELDDVKGRFVYSTGGIDTHQFQAYHFTPEYIVNGNYKVGRMLSGSIEETNVIEVNDTKETHFIEENKSQSFLNGMKKSLIAKMHNKTTKNDITEEPIILKEDPKDIEQTEEEEVVKPSKALDDITLEDF